MTSLDLRDTAIVNESLV